MEEEFEIYKCEDCGKVFYSVKEYKLETEGVDIGWMLVPRHKDEFCSAKW